MGLSDRVSTAPCKIIRPAQSYNNALIYNYDVSTARLPACLPIDSLICNSSAEVLLRNDYDNSETNSKIIVAAETNNYYIGRSVAQKV